MLLKDMPMSLGLSRNFYLAIMLIFFLFFLHYYFLNSEKNQEKEEEKKALEIKKGYFTGYEKGKEVYRLWTEKLIQNEDKNEIYLQKVRGEYLVKKGKIELEAKKAYWNQKTSYLKLIGDVVLKGISGEIITSQELFFNQKTKAVFSPVPLEIKSQDYYARGDKMSGNVSRKFYKLVGEGRVFISQKMIKNTPSEEKGKRK